MAVADSNRFSSGQEKKGPWSTDEDDILKQNCDEAPGVERRYKWAEIAALIKGRSAKQCRERWEQNLKPGINKGPITDYEGHQIVAFVQQRGKKWAQIARELNNRSDNAVKNWYNGMIQKHKSRRHSPHAPHSPHSIYDEHFCPAMQAFIDRQHGSNRTHYHPYHRPEALPHHHQSTHYEPTTYHHAPQQQHYATLPNPHHTAPQHHQADLSLPYPPLPQQHHLDVRAASQTGPHQYPIDHPNKLPPMKTSGPYYGERSAPLLATQQPPPFAYSAHAPASSLQSTHPEQRRPSLAVSHGSPTPAYLSDEPDLSHSRGATPHSVLASPVTPLSPPPPPNYGRHFSQSSQSSGARLEAATQHFKGAVVQPQGKESVAEASFPRGLEGFQNPKEDGNK